MVYVMVVIFEIARGVFTPPIAVYAYDTLAECMSAPMPDNAASVTCDPRR